MTVRTIAIAVLVFAFSCGGDDDKKEGSGGETDKKGSGGVPLLGDVAAAPAGPAGAAPAKSLFGGKFAGIFGKATAGAQPQSAGDLTQVFGKSLPTLTPALAGMGVTGAPGAPAPAAAGGGQTQALWAFAPPDAAFGLVAADGSLAEVASAIGELVRVASAAPGGAQLVQMATAELIQAGIDPSNLAGWAQQSGVDIGKGFAMFASTAGNVVVVLPVKDPAAFRKAVKDDEGNLDDKHCVMAPGRYVCAPQLAWAQAAVAPHDSPLAQRAAALPAWLHGDVELVTHLGSFPGAVQELQSLDQMMTQIGTLAVAANLDRGSLSVRGWLEGKRSGPIGDAFAAIPPATLSGESAGATNFFHIRTPWQLITAMMPMPPSMPIGPGVDARADLIDNLTGEVVTYSRGNEFLAEHLSLALRDPARAARAVEFLCDAAISAKVVPGLKKGAGSCSGTVKLRELLEQNPDVKPFVEGMPAVPVMVQVAGKNLEIKVGWPGPAAGQAADNAGSDIARELMTGNWHFVMWGMGFDPLAVAPGPLQKKLTAALMDGMGPQEKAGMNMLRWMYGHLYDAGLAWAMREDGMYLLAQVTTYAGDPPDAYAGHQQALTAMVNNDYGSYRQISAELGKRFPQSLAGRHGANVARGVSILGQFGVWGIGMSSALFAKKKEDRVVTDVPVTPAMPPVVAPGHGAGASDAEVERLIGKFADKVCKCRDMACVQKVSTEFGQKMAGRQPNMQSPKNMAAMQKIAACAQKIAQ